MVVKNPNIDLRIGIGQLLAGSGVAVYNKRVPISVATPTKYILVTSQSKQEYEQSKGCFEWNCTFNLDINYLAPLGTDMTREVDITEEYVLERIYALTVPNWHVKNVELINSIDLDIDTTKKTINRRVLTFNVWLWR